jgi:hypothetical protein
MRYNIPVALLAALSLGACASKGGTVQSGGDVDLSATPVNAATLPAGSNLTITLDQAIGTKTSRVGDTFSGTVAEAISAENGQTVVPAGSKVYGKVTALKQADNATQTAAIRLNFERLEVNGRSHPFDAKITATNLKTERDRTRNETLKSAGVGAAAGAVLGAILSEGDLGKAALGALLGGVAGTAISLGTGDTQAVLPAGSEMRLQTTRVVALRRS